MTFDVFFISLGFLDFTIIESFKSRLIRLTLGSVEIFLHIEYFIQGISTNNMENLPSRSIMDIFIQLEYMIFKNSVLGHCAI